MAKKRQTKADNNSVLTIVLVVAAVFLFSGGNLSTLLTGNAAQRGSQAVFCPPWHGITLQTGTSEFYWLPGGVEIANCVEVNGRGQLNVDKCVKDSIRGYQGLTERQTTYKTSIDDVEHVCAPLNLQNSLGARSGIGVGF